jgi:hypothetical protein
MGKKRSKGVTVFAWLLIVLNFLGLLAFLDFKSIFDLYKSFNKIFAITVISYGLFSTTIGIISGYGILKLKEIMRKIAVAINALDVISTIILLFITSNAIWNYSYSFAESQLAGKGKMHLNVDTAAAVGFYSAIFVNVLFIGLSLLNIFFFTRPKVKEQFKK